MISAPLSFAVDAFAEGETTLFTVRPSDGESRRYRVAGGDPLHYEQFFEALSRDFGTRLPRTSTLLPLPAASRRGGR